MSDLVESIMKCYDKDGSVDAIVKKGSNAKDKGKKKPKSTLNEKNKKVK